MSQKQQEMVQANRADTTKSNSSMNTPNKRMKSKGSDVKRLIYCGDRGGIHLNYQSE